MADVFSPSKRSLIMSKIRSKGTSAEKAILSIISTKRLKYDLYNSSLPGKPDFVFPKKKKIIFAHGCFWHQHKNCNRATKPKSHKSYWLPKLENNMKRDKKYYKDLKKMGYKILIVWECEIKKTETEKLEAKISKFLS